MINILFANTVCFSYPQNISNCFCGRSASFSLPQYKTVSTSTSHHRSFPNPEQWVWCVNTETGFTRTHTIPDASEKDVTSHCMELLPKKVPHGTAWNCCQKKYQTSSIINRNPGIFCKKRNEGEVGKWWHRLLSCKVNSSFTVCAQLLIT